MSTKPPAPRLEQIAAINSGALAESYPELTHAIAAVASNAESVSALVDRMLARGAALGTDALDSDAERHFGAVRSAAKANSALGDAAAALTELLNELKFIG
jgi:hypothetical protein